MTRHPFESFALAASLLLLLGAGAVAGPSPTSSDLPVLPSAPAHDPVRARLIAESDAIVPGGAVWVAVVLNQEEGWHTYWKNGGDSGLPTEVIWDLPEGFVVGPLQWPTPHRYVEAGDLVTYGYEGEVALLARIEAPADASGSVTLRARADWLMCKELCIPGGADLEFTLPVRADVNTAPATDTALFAASRNRLPRPVDAIEGLAVRLLLDLDVVPPGQLAHLGIEVQGEVVETWTWFPEYDARVVLGAPFEQRAGDRLRLGIPVDLSEKAEPGTMIPVAGVLELVTRSGAEHFVDVRVELPVAQDDQAVQATHEEFFGVLLGEASGGLFDQDFSGARGAATGDRGLIYYLLLALVGGVILNVMPCVLPVLSLKVMSFVRHAGEDRGVQFRLGLTFALGVLVSFLALALVVVVLQAAGDQLGWGFQFQNPGFVLVMAAVVFAFGLSLFGVYEIVLPMQFGAGGGKTGAYAESFLNGILATALATPCTAPFLGTALGFAFTQPAYAIVAIFLTIGVGLALPYVLLSLNPAWLRFVPKPGAWMERFKQAMGFLLMATLIWLLWVLGQQAGIDGAISAMAFLLVLGFALWLYGSMLDLSSGTGRRLVVWALMLLLVGAGWWQFVRGPLSAEVVASHAASSQGEHADGDIVWQDFSVPTLEAEVAAGNTVFIDFTAAWCTTCKVNEKTVLATDEVHAKFRELGVVTLLGDWTNRDPEITQVLRSFGRSGVPFYAVFPAGRLDAPIVLPEVITKGLVLEALEQAGPSRGLASR